jgi:exodeoxyribonuclease VII small subunit|tara:strand:- start:114 stop:359 length:246 start_codon:yes stop_codon:yes gene_type:complete
MTKIPDDIKKLSFEKALGELEEIVDNLESGSVDLEQSIGHYTRGSLLRLHCQNKLDEAVLKLEEVKVSSDGKVSKNKANET